jgi:hypothetical protein
VWPWLKEHTDIPSAEFQQDNSEVTGNIHEGFR